jgi:hypothetical protein
MGPWLGTVVIDSAAYDLTQIMDRPHQDLYDEPWGAGIENYSHWVAGSPFYQLDYCPPPMFLITSTTTNPGESDNNVGPYKDAVVAMGGQATIYHTSLEHADTNSQLGLISDYTTAVTDFIEGCLI